METQTGVNEMTVKAVISVEAFVKFYLAGNEEAQKVPVESKEFKGAYQIADEMGLARNSMEWDAAVGGAAAFLLRGHTFTGGAGAIAA